MFGFLSLIREKLRHLSGLEPLSVFSWHLHGMKQLADDIIVISLIGGLTVCQTVLSLLNVDCLTHFTPGPPYEVSSQPFFKKVR